MRQWIENQLQQERQTKLRIEGAIAALEAMLKQLDNDGQQQQATAAEEPVVTGPADVPQPDVSEGPAAESLESFFAAAIDFPADHD